jgi:2-polyprenyl-6-methoxyphenol hydroxylase-like FAD-dependent oxidoreductase
MPQIHSSYTAALILRKAFERFGVDGERYRVVTTASHLKPGPEILLLQPGGLIALDRLGIPLGRLMKEGQPVQGLRFFERCGGRGWAIRHTIVGEGKVPPALAIPTKRLAEILADVQPPEPCGEPQGEWVVRKRRTGMAVQVCGGELDLDGLGMLWDSGKFHVGIVDVGDGKLLRYAVAAGDGMGSQEGAAVSFDAAADIHSSRLSIGEVHHECWFPERSAGVAKASSDGVLLWGCCAADLHPLTGQTLSYWAGEAVWLANKLAGERADEPFAALAARSHARNLAMFRRNSLITGYHLRHSLLWQIARRPYTLALRKFHPARLHAMKLLALI